MIFRQANQVLPSESGLYFCKVEGVKRILKFDINAGTDGKGSFVEGIFRFIYLDTIVWLDEENDIPSDELIPEGKVEELNIVKDGKVETLTKVNDLE